METNDNWKPRKSSYRYDAGAIEQWGRMRIHLQQIRAYYASLDQTQKHNGIRMDLWHYERKLMLYIQKLEKMITIQFIEEKQLDQEWGLETGY